MTDIDKLRANLADLENEYPSRRARAARALEKLGDPAALEALQQAFEREKDAQARKRMATAIRRLGGDPQPPKPKPGPAPGATRTQPARTGSAAGKERQKEEEPPFLPQPVVSKSLPERSRWEDAAPVVHDEEHDTHRLQEQTAALKSSDPAIREQAAWTLGRSGNPQAVKPLQQALGTEQDTEVRKAIQKAIQSIAAFERQKKDLIRAKEERQKLQDAQERQEEEEFGLFLRSLEQRSGIPVVEEMREVYRHLYRQEGGREQLLQKAEHDKRQKAEIDRVLEAEREWLRIRCARCKEKRGSFQAVITKGRLISNISTTSKTLAGQKTTTTKTYRVVGSEFLLICDTCIDREKRSGMLFNSVATLFGWAMLLLLALFINDWDMAIIRDYFPLALVLLGIALAVVLWNTIKVDEKHYADLVAKGILQGTEEGITYFTRDEYKGLKERIIPKSEQ